MKSESVWKINKIVLPQHSDHAGVMWHGNYFYWLEEARIKANDILRNCKDEIKRNTQEAIADIDIKIAELIKTSEKNIVSLKVESKKEVSNLSNKLAPEIVKLLIS